MAHRTELQKGEKRTLGGVRRKGTPTWVDESLVKEIENENEKEDIKLEENPKKTILNNSYSLGLTEHEISIQDAILTISNPGDNIKSPLESQSQQTDDMAGIIFGRCPLNLPQEPTQQAADGGPRKSNSNAMIDKAHSCTPPVRNTGGMEERLEFSDLTQEEWNELLASYFSDKGHVTSIEDIEGTEEIPLLSGHPLQGHMAEQIDQSNNGA
ncbi:hypothetical protein NDU88_007064 [Pleurodeles waltl]|uniref:Uncharacterized protein n=1 Tax=Pleurodeles waltl TaxID=8319 RepID=A0AAV7UP21_PLEWA|nr:hypothetical protein NDU88_007064 [Pleurodeles waltl]